LDEVGFAGATRDVLRGKKSGEPHGSPHQGVHQLSTSYGSNLNYGSRVVKK
jgi:hypothetical protein